MNSDLKESVVNLRHKQHSYPEIAKILNIHPERARALYRRRHTKSHDNTVDFETTYSTSENMMQVSHVTDRIMSLDDLLDALEIDREEWEILRFKITKGEIGRRHEKKNLEFDEGKITGSIEDSGTIYVEPLFNITAWLVRKNPIPITPVVSPVSIHITPVTTRKISNSKIKTALILPDIHVGFSRDMSSHKLTPFHDRLALDITLQAAKLIKPEVIVFLGDILDLADWSDRFVRSPEMYWTTQSSVIEASWWLGEFRLACPNSDIYILEGNHDRRMEDLLVKHLVSAYQLKPAKVGQLNPPSLSIENLLSLQELDIKYIGDYPNGRVWLNESLSCTHGNVARANSGGTTSAVVRGLDSSEIHGHIHRKEWASKTVHGKYGTRTIDAFSPGCLCRIDGVVPAKKSNNNWQQGFATVTYDLEDAYNIVPYAIERGVSIFGSWVLKGKNNVNQIEKDTGWTLA